MILPFGAVDYNIIRVGSCIINNTMSMIHWNVTKALCDGRMVLQRQCISVILPLAR